jgi:superfamily I DNA/RNA helicase/mRNA-degrading endonuclease RelE of RelBE toxin-antitoxin system
MTTPQVALSKDFMEAYSRLPRTIQKKVREFTEKFQRDPTQSGINFERLNEARDPKVRSVRIDQAYRAIVIHPPKGDVYLCAWVDHHDEAYQWARNRVFEVNPRSGSFQVFDEQQATETVQASAPAEEAQARLFDEHDDETLLLAGVPQPLLASIRGLVTEADLDTLAPYLPPDTGEMLYLLAAGYDLLEAIEEADRSKPDSEEVDVDDFGKAMEKPESLQGFKVVANEAELDAIMNAPLEKWRVFLHPSQSKLVGMKANGPVRVLGGAGTGKTVVLMHRARHLAADVFRDDNDRVLVTTFTRNLAIDLGMNLSNLCTRDVFARIEVTNLHSWAVDFMRKQGHKFRIADDRERRQFFDQAMIAADETFPAAFYMDEWDQVVQGQEIDNRDDYFTARRVGRGTRLSRRQRADVWNVLGQYRELLDGEGKVEWADVIRETRLYIEKQQIPLPYKAVLADEVQDFSASELRLLRTVAPEGANSLFMVGDGHQRIYGQPVTMSSCGIEIRGRSRRLKLNYRTTQQIRERAVAVLEGRELDDLDGGVDSLKGSFSLREGPSPVVRNFPREVDEAAFVVETVKRWMSETDPRNVCLAVRTNNQLSSRYAPLLQAEGIDTTVVERDPKSESEQPGVRLATMHRLKGLEFSRVLLCGVQEGNVPLDVPGDPADSESRQRHELQERCLLYVAATRARDELAVCGFGSPSPFLPESGE